MPRGYLDGKAAALSWSGDDHSMTVVGAMPYEQRLRAIGRLIDAAGLRDVAVTETAEGVLVTGVTPLDRRAGILGVGAKSLLLSQEQIARADREIAGKRGWFRHG